MKRILIFMVIVAVVVAGCGRGEEPPPSSGVESGEVPGAEGSDEGAAQPDGPASTVPGATQQPPSAAPEEEPAKKEGTSSAKQPEPKKEAPKQPGGGALDAALVSRGKAKFGEVGCTNCHAVGGEGGKVGPDLTHVGEEHPDVQFYLGLLNDPTKLGKQGMPSFAHLAADDLRALAEYLRSLR